MKTHHHFNILAIFSLALILFCSCNKELNEPLMAQNAAQIKPNGPRGARPGFQHNQRAMQLAAEGKLSDAIGELKTAINLEPDNPLNYVQIARVYEQTGSIESAIVNLKQATELDDKNPMTHYQLGAVYKKIGDTKASSVEVKTARRLMAELPQSSDANSIRLNAINGDAYYDQFGNAYGIKSLKKWASTDQAQ